MLRQPFIAVLFVVTLIDSIVHLDRPVVVAYLLAVVLLLVLINLVVDILYSVLDPRVRLGNAQ